MVADFSFFAPYRLPGLVEGIPFDIHDLEGIEEILVPDEVESETGRKHHRLALTVKRIDGYAFRSDSGFEGKESVRALEYFCVGRHCEGLLSGAAASGEKGRKSGHNQSVYLHYLANCTMRELLGATVTPSLRTTFSPVMTLTPVTGPSTNSR